MQFSYLHFEMVPVFATLIEWLLDCWSDVLKMLGCLNSKYENCILFANALIEVSHILSTEVVAHMVQCKKPQAFSHVPWLMLSKPCRCLSPKKRKISFLCCTKTQNYMHWQLTTTGQKGEICRFTCKYTVKNQCLSADKLQLLWTDC